MGQESACYQLRIPSVGHQLLVTLNYPLRIVVLNKMLNALADEYLIVSNLRREAFKLFEFLRLLMGIEPRPYMVVKFLHAII